MLRHRLSSLVLAALVTAPLRAAGDVVIGRDARTAVALTVYAGQDLALVRETRTADLGSGDARLRFEDVAAHLDPRTVTLEAADDPASLAPSTFPCRRAGRRSCAIACVPAAGSVARRPSGAARG